MDTAAQRPAPLHPDTQKYLDSMAEMMETKNIPPLWSVEIDRRRALNRMLIAAGQPHMEPCELVEDVEIPARGGALKGRVYRGAAGDAAGSLPVVVYYHGGGFAMGGIAESENECRGYAAHVPAVVVVVEYRKTPEHPYPAQDEDAYDAALWAAEHAAHYGGDPARLVLAGTSCGACLATATARRLIERGGPRAAKVISVTPWYDKTLSQPSMGVYVSGYPPEPAEIEHYRDLYMPNGAADADPYNSPAIYPALPEMPPHYILVAECDAVADESYAFAEKLKQVEVPCEVVTAKGLIHAFTLLTHLIPVANDYMDDLYEAVRRA